MATHQFLANLIDQRAIKGGMFEHAERINGPWMLGNPPSLIDLNDARLFTGDMIDVGANIMKRLAEMQVTQADLAKATGLSTQRLNNYIKGHRPPDIESLVKIAKALRVTTDYLLGVSEAPPTDTRAVILRLLELDGMNPDRAEAIAEVATRALQLLSSLPDEGESRTRALLAAQAAWQTRLQSKLS